MPIKFYKSKIQNESNIGHDYAKIKAIPPDVTLVGFRKRARQGQGGTEFEEQVMYNVPTGLHIDFERWALGYASAFLSPGGSAAQLSRTVPAQHPLKPWLYAVAVEMTDGYGAQANDDRNASGQYPDGSQVNIDVGTKQPVPFGQQTNNGTFPLVLEMPSYRDSSTATDGYVAMTVTYAELPYAVKNDAQLQGLAAQPGNASKEIYRWVERRSDLNVTRLPLPSNALIFRDDALKFPGAAHKNMPKDGSPIPDSAAAVLIQIRDVVWTWYQVPDLNWAAWEAVAGNLNSNYFDGQTADPQFAQIASGNPVAFIPLDKIQGHAPKTLLMYAPKVRESRMGSVNGRPMWDITFHAQKMLGIANGGGLNATPVARTWNMFPAADGFFYRAVKTDGSDPYTSVDWGQVFSIPSNPYNYD